MCIPRRLPLTRGLRPWKRTVAAFKPGSVRKVLCCRRPGPNGNSPAMYILLVSRTRWHFSLCCSLVWSSGRYATHCTISKKKNALRPQKGMPLQRTTQTSQMRASNPPKQSGFFSVGPLCWVQARQWWPSCDPNHWSVRRRGTSPSGCGPSEVFLSTAYALK